MDALRNILVPVSANRESEQAMDVACRLAADHHACIVAVAVVEVPPLLPLDAHMSDEEARAHSLLHRTAAIAESYGVTVKTRIARGRDAADVVVAEANARGSEIIVIAAPRHRRQAFGPTVAGVLKKATCKVLLIGGAPGSQPVAA